MMDDRTSWLIEFAYKDELEKISGKTSESLGRLVRPVVDTFIGKAAPAAKAPKPLRELGLIERMRMGREGRKAYTKKRKAALEQLGAEAQRTKDIENVLSTAGKAGVIGGTGLLAASALGS